MPIPPAIRRCARCPDPRGEGPRAARGRGDARTVSSPDGRPAAAPAAPRSPGSFETFFDGSTEKAVAALSSSLPRGSPTRSSTVCPADRPGRLEGADMHATRALHRAIHFATDIALKATGLFLATGGYSCCCGADASGPASGGPRLRLAAAALPILSLRRSASRFRSFDGGRHRAGRGSPPPRWRCGLARGTAGSWSGSAWLAARAPDRARARPYETPTGSRSATPRPALSLARRRAEGEREGFGGVAAGV